MRLLRSISLTIMLGLSGIALAELPQISDARVVQPPPGAKVAAAYFTISNPGSEPLLINGAASGVAKQVEVHLSFVENDIAKMEKQESVVVPAGESVEFKHGSFHVMFMGLNESLLAGNSLNLVLNTSAGDLPVVVPVISLDESMSMGKMKHKMNHDADQDMNSMNHEMHNETKEAMPTTNMKDGMHEDHQSK